MVPRTSDCLTHHQSLIQRTAVVSADGAHRKYLIALPHQDNRFAVIVAQEWLVFGESVDGHARLEIGTR
jgi:hypothetical protein